MCIRDRGGGAVKGPIRTVRHADGFFQSDHPLLCTTSSILQVPGSTSWASQETDKVPESFGATASELGLEKQKHWPRHNTAHAKMNIRKSLSLFVRLHLAEISTKTQKHQRPHTNCYESRRSRPRWNLVDEMLNTQGEHRYNFPCPILHPSSQVITTKIKGKIANLRCSAQFAIFDLKLQPRIRTTWTCANNLKAGLFTSFIQDN